ncbi:GLPGLI family protein [Dysgonomonas sp. 521]|uniref:GLPGLI family protein n=1 Tax=Dysgonomonas sp. 521 TaxID=2302932 RepID=UPI0013D25379|nr:GLPGLI family protein [Dysgonomonas sp. 521]
MKRLVLSFLFILSMLSVFSQKVIKIESGKISKDKLDEATIRCYYKFSQPIIIDKDSLLQTDTLTLDIGAKASLYYDASRARRDSVFGDFMANRLDPNTIQSMTVLKDADASAFDGTSGTTIESGSKGETAQLYKNRQAGEITIIERADNSVERYKCVDKITPQWDITPDTLTVLGYRCQKATTNFRGRTYDAWFTSDIPVNDGPWKLYGLPGLILKAQDAENIFSFEIIGLEQLNPSVDISMAKSDYIKANRKDMEKLKKKQSGGMVVNVNGGNVTIIQKKNNSESVSLEKE